MPETLALLDSSIIFDELVDGGNDFGLDIPYSKKLKINAHIINAVEIKMKEINANHDISNFISI